MNHVPDDAPLGKAVTYPTGYDASLLFPIARASARADIGIDASALPFIGGDLWNAYEMSWLNQRGLPRVVLLRVQVPGHSPNIIESKSFKLYLNGFNQTCFATSADVIVRLTTDLSAAAGAAVSVHLIEASAFAQERIEELDGTDLDVQEVAIDRYEPEPAYLQSAAGQPVVSEKMFSRWLKSNCPVTGQPDWACVQIAYTGHPIDHVGLLKYIVSFRMHSGFHEHCVERMFTDIMRRCRPQSLSVYARYTRRGGMDINPWRATHDMPAPTYARSARQ